MRTLPLVGSLAAFFLSLPRPATAADARKGCDVEITSKDEIVRSGDVVVGPGEHARKVVALSGTVRVKSGATIEEAVALGGAVVVERGAAITGDVTSVGGDIRLEQGARVDGNATTVGGKLHVAEGAALRGERHSVQAEIDGVSLAQYVVGAVSAALRDADCRIRVRED